VGTGVAFRSSLLTKYYVLTKEGTNETVSTDEQKKKHKCKRNFRRTRRVNSKKPKKNIQEWIKYTYKFGKKKLNNREKRVNLQVESSDRVCYTSAGIDILGIDLVSILHPVRREPMFDQVQDITLQTIFHLCIPKEDLAKPHF
jgi:hypothetical protein